MKKWTALLIALVMCLSLCACGGGQEAVEETPDPEQLLRDKMEFVIDTYCSLYYSVKASNVAKCYIEIDDNGVYRTTGKARMTDEYGDTYEAKFEGLYEFNEEDGDFKQINFKMETPTKIS